MGRLDIPAISKAFFATVMPFRTEEGRNRFDYDTFRRTMNEVFAAQESAAGARQIDFEIYEDSKYAMVSLVDELSIVSDWTYRNEWAMEPLELKIFNSNVAGEEFYDRLVKLRKRFDQSRDPTERDTLLGAIEVFFTCLECGFKGRFRGAEGELSAVRKGLLALLWPDAEGRQHRALFPSAYGEAGQVEKRRRRRNMWPLMVAATILVMVGFYVIFQFLLGGTARDMEGVVRTRVDESLSSVDKGDK
jgi:type IV/VI secretion system ImpK/VasF family protein